MKILNELVELAKRANVAGQGTPEMVEFRVVANPDTIIAIAEAFRELEQRAEAAEAKLAATNDEAANERNLRAKFETDYKLLEAKLAEMERQEPVAEVNHDGTFYGFKALENMPEGNYQLFTRPASAVSLAELVPEGWKLVPVEPTESMMSDGFKELIESADPDLGVNLSAVYRRILASSPTPTQ